MRTHRSSTADNPASKMYAFEAGRRVIAAHLERSGVKGPLRIRRIWDFTGCSIRWRDSLLFPLSFPIRMSKKHWLPAFVPSVKRPLTKNYEILLVENNSTTEEIFAYYQELSRRKTSACSAGKRSSIIRRSIILQIRSQGRISPVFKQ